MEDRLISEVPTLSCSLRLALVLAGRPAAAGPAVPLKLVAFGALLVPGLWYAAVVRTIAALFLHATVLAHEAAEASGASRSLFAVFADEMAPFVNLMQRRSPTAAHASVNASTHSKLMVGRGYSARHAWQRGRCMRRSCSKSRKEGEPAAWRSP